MAPIRSRQIYELPLIPGPFDGSAVLVISLGGTTYKATLASIADAVAGDANTLIGVVKAAAEATAASATAAAGSATTASTGAATVTALAAVIQALATQVAADAEEAAQAAHPITYLSDEDILLGVRVGEVDIPFALMRNGAMEAFASRFESGKDGSAAWRAMIGGAILRLAGGAPALSITDEAGDTYFDAMPGYLAGGGMEASIADDGGVTFYLRGAKVIDWPAGQDLPTWYGLPIRQIEADGAFLVISGGGGEGTAVEIESRTGLLKVMDEPGLPYSFVDEVEGASVVFVDPVSGDGVAYGPEEGTGYLKALGSPGGGSGGGGATFAGQSIAAKDAENRAAAQEFIRQGPDSVIAFDGSANDILAMTLGQSTGNSDQSTPPITRTAEPNTFMLGDSVWPLGSVRPDWVPMGAAVKRPLLSVYKNTNTTVASYTMGDALGPGNAGQSLGENVVVSFCRNLARLTRNFRGTTPNIWGQSAAVSGTAAEEWLPDNPEASRLSDRFPTCCQAVKTAVEAGGGTWALGAILYHGHEYNDSEAGSVAPNGRVVDGTRAGYAAVQKEVLDAMMAELQAIQPQRLPIVLFHQSGRLSEDTTEQAVCMGQLDLAEANPNMFIAGPWYPYPEWGIHMDSNGYRWDGAKEAQVAYRVLVKRENWRPLMPLQTVYRGRQCLTSFHVPVPPLVWDSPFVLHTRTALPNHGFRYYDDQGDLPLVSIEILGATMVGAVFGRDPVSAPRLSIGGKALFNRKAGLRDSDAALAMDPWVYDPAIMPPSMSDADLNGKPLPLHNWVVQGVWGAEAV
jgi:hypothetical protein